MRKTLTQPLGMAGLVVSILFLIMSIAVVIWVGSSNIRYVSDWIQMKNAVRSEATITDVQRIWEHVGDGERERVIVSFDYEHAGKKYSLTTDRLALCAAEGPIEAKISAAYRDQKTIMCFVDPDRPEFCLFSTEFDANVFWTVALFPIFFGTVGGIIIWALIKHWRTGTLF